MLLTLRETSTRTCIRQSVASAREAHHSPGRYRDVDDQDGKWRPAVWLQFNFDDANGNDRVCQFPAGTGGQLYGQADKDTIPDLHYMNFEAYVQDDWKVTLAPDFESWHPL